MRDLSEIRVEIDKVDEEIKRLYKSRLDLALEVAEYKIANNKPVFDPVRENEKIKKLTEEESGSLKISIAGLFNKLMRDSRRLQHERMNQVDKSIFDFKPVDSLGGDDIRVIYQGEPGAYSQSAAREFFGNISSVTNVSTWRDAMEAVKNNNADYCVLPIENSTAGSVTEIYDLLPEYDLTIVGEQVISIEHALLAPHGAELSDIRKVYSHPQALMQCAEYLRNHPNMESEKVINTAFAAKKVKEDADITKAAIAGEINAEIYGLKVLDKSIQDENNNKTRFIVLSKDKKYIKGSEKISMSFGLKHETGSLYNALSYLSDHGINLSLIESRPIRTRNWEYRFFIDIEGNLNEEKIKWAISGLLGVTNDFRILGNY